MLRSLDMRSLTGAGLLLTLAMAIIQACGSDEALPEGTGGSPPAGGAPGSGGSAGGGSGGTVAAGSSSGGSSSGGSAQAGSSGSGGGGNSSGGSSPGGSSSGGSASGGSGGSFGPGPPGPRVRIVAANLSSGNLQNYDGGEGVRILQGLDADIILIQEFNYGSNTPMEIRTLVDSICVGMWPCTYVRGPQAQIPNGIISRFPIVDSGSIVDPEVSNRTFMWARLDIPGDIDLWAFSVHLLSSSATKRALEAIALIDYIEDNISEADYVVLGGDFNTNTRAESAVTTMSSAFVTTGPYPVDHDSNDGTNAPRSKPYDWVIVDSDLQALSTPVVLGASSFSSGAVIDTRVYQPLSEISPALATDSAAPSMQHMAVVRDFSVP